MIITSICFCPKSLYMGITLFLFFLLLHNYAIITTLCVAKAPNNITTDQLALLALKAHITHDPQNMLQTNWSVHDHVSVCNWIGVTCGSKHRRVIALNLSNMGVTATLPPHLGNLSFLAYFNIAFNNFHGALPVELASLRRLKFIHLGNNGFSGDIPSWLGSLPQLQTMYLYGNKFTGVIPSSFGNLSKLEDLALFSNDLRGEVPITLGNLSNLRYLFLDHNQLSGCLPSGIFNGLSELQAVDLSSNKISGRIPKSLIKCKKLAYLRMCDNNLTGEIPSIERMASLKYIEFSNNSFTGRIPTLPPSLLWLCVSMNKLVGEIPTSTCNLSSLIYIDMSTNNLGGIIPHCLGNLSSHLLYMNLNRNNFHGTIPAQIFSRNCLLRGFGINHNQFEGSIPQSLANCKELEILDVGNNILNDTFPSWLEHLDHLKVLILRSNRLHGQLVNSQVLTSDFSFSSLRIIDLSGNHFSGALPSKFFRSLYAIVSCGNETKGEVEYMSYNYSGISYAFRPKLPISTKGSEIELPYILTTLTIIDLSSNQFFGHIPETLGQLQSLRALNLSHNGLTGHIPSSLSNLSMLESFDLSSNKLQGRIPVEFTNLGFLEVFNLSMNNLWGPIPQDKQFHTLGNDSYIGNPGLCGPPLSKNCGKGDMDSEPTPRTDRFDEAKTSGLNWKHFIVMGYGCGLALGLSVGYIVFTIGKPWWIVQIVERVQQKYVASKICRGRK